MTIRNLTALSLLTLALTYVPARVVVAEPKLANPIDNGSLLNQELAQCESAMTTAGSGDIQSSCSGGGGPGPTPTPTVVTPGNSPGLSGASTIAANLGIYQILELERRGIISLLADGLAEPDSGTTASLFPQLWSISDPHKDPYTSPLALLNPLTAMLSPPQTSAAVFGAGSQTLNCSQTPQLIWVAEADHYTEPDHVGDCAQVPTCRDSSGLFGPAGGGSSAETYYARYRYAFGNSLSVLGCSDVVVVGAGYKEYDSGATVFFRKNSFAWRSNRPSGDRMRFLHRDVGCEVTGPLWDINQKSCPGGSNSQCGPGTCSSHRARFSEATAVLAGSSAEAINVVGEMSWQTSFNVSNYAATRRSGFLWRSPFTYPLNLGSVNQLSSHNVPKDRLGDSIHLLSHPNFPGSAADPFAVALDITQRGSSLEVVGVNREYNPDPPSHIYGAAWSLSSFVQGSNRALVPHSSLYQSTDPEYSTSLVAATTQNDTLTTRGLEGVLGTPGECSMPNGCQHLAAKVDFPGGGGHAVTLLSDEMQWGAVPSQFHDDFLWTRATAISQDGRFTAGQAYDARQSEISYAASQGRSISYGFKPGVPVLWAENRNPQAIALPADHVGVALSVASYGSSQAIVVGTMAPLVADAVLKGFISVCTLGASEVCCSPATSVTDYLESKGISIGGNAKMFTTSEARVVGNTLYLTGTGRESTGHAKPYLAKVQFSNSCAPVACG